jgi:hypothetical protein
MHSINEGGTANVNSADMHIYLNDVCALVVRGNKGVSFVDDPALLRTLRARLKECNRLLKRLERTK